MQSIRYHEPGPHCNCLRIQIDSPLKKLIIHHFRICIVWGQCSPDLSRTDCNTCLAGDIGHLSHCCYGVEGGRVLNPSCNIRFEVYPFYHITASAPSPSPSIFTPPPPTPSNSNTIAGGNTIKSGESLQLDFSTVLAATNNFADDNKIGEGGFGGVFKEKLLDGQEIAVKRLSRNSGQGREEFKNEAVLVAKPQHRNLVRLLGYCLEGEKILIYEFVPNKLSLR